MSLLAVLVALFGMWQVRAVPNSASEAARVEAAVQSVLNSTSLPEGLRFTQHVTLRAFLLRWSFESELEYHTDGLSASTHGAPRFVPKTLPSELALLGRTLSLFDLNVVSFNQETDELHLQGPRPDFTGKGAKEGEFWIDVGQGVVRKAEAVYPWGILTVEQEYQSIGGHVLLKRQAARISPHGATLEVVYSDYVLP